MRLTPIWRLIPGAALILLTAGSSLALTLGRVQGVALIGQPLDVTVQATLDAGASRDDLCPQVQVFYGETQINSRVVDLVPGPGPDVTNIRVRVGTPVNEAFVTVYLEIGCSNTKSSRRFVLLTEQPGDIARAALQPSPVAPAVDARAVIAAPTQRSGGALEIQPLPAAAPLQAPSTSTVTEPTAAPRPVTPEAAPRPLMPEAAPRPVTPEAAPARPRPAPRPATPRAAAPRPAPKPAAAPQVVERPRLRLDAPQVRLDNAPAARAAVAASQAASPASAAVANASASVPAATASAPAATASAASPPDELQRMQALEADIRSMRDLMVKNNAAVTELRARLEQAERERFSNPLVYALLALFAASSALAGLFWHRSRKAQAAQQDWWANNGGRGGLPDSAGGGAAAADATPQAGLSNDAKAAGAVAAVAATAAVVASQSAASADTPVVAAAPVPPARPFAPSGSDALHASDVEPPHVDDVNKVQQQAQVFASQGDHDSAIGVLRAHIDAHPQGSAAPWIQLMTLLHGLARRDDFEQVRRDYEWLFNTKVDAFDRFGLGDSGPDAPSSDSRPVNAVQADAPAAPTLPAAVEAPVIDDPHASLDLNLDELLKMPSESAPAKRAPDPVATANDNLLDFDFELDPKPDPSDKDK